MKYKWSQMESQGHGQPLVGNVQALVVRQSKVLLELEKLRRDGWLARLLLMIAALCASFCALVLTVVTWPVGAIFIVLVAISRVHKRKIRLTTLGSAIWASEKDIRQAGMLDAKTGLIIGRLL